MFIAKLSFLTSHLNTLPYTVTDHFHDCYEIVYYLSGRGTTTIGGIAFDYTPHTFCVIPPKTYHSEVAAEETEIIYFGFNFDSSAGAIPPYLLEDGNKDFLTKILKIKEELHSRKQFYEAAITAELTSLTVEILRLLDLTVLDTEKHINPFEYIINYMNSNYANKIDIRALSESINYSYDRFRHIFKTLYHISPVQYIINTRINQAKILLQSSGKPVAEIAGLCGFNSAAQFITTFRREVGITPARYKKSAKAFQESAVYDEMGYIHIKGKN